MTGASPGMADNPVTRAGARRGHDRSGAAKSHGARRDAAASAHRTDAAAARDVDTGVWEGARWGGAGLPARRTGYRRGVCRHYNEAGGCQRGDHCLYHHVPEQVAQAQYMGVDDEQSDIHVEIDGASALTIRRDGTVQLSHSIPRVWEHFRALNIVLRAVDLRVRYKQDVQGDWTVERNSARRGAMRTLVALDSCTSVLAFESTDFGAVRERVRALPTRIQVTRVPNAPGKGA